jgi:hypothetical protein
VILINDFTWLLMGVAAGVLMDVFATAGRHSRDQRRAREMSRRIAALDAKCDRLQERLQERP